MTRYHFNPTTGRPGKCAAKAGKCPFTAQGSSHYDTVEEARSAIEEYFAKPFVSLAGRLAVQRSRIQREILRRYSVDKNWNNVADLVPERDSLDEEILAALPAEGEDLFSPEYRTPLRLAFENLNHDLGDKIIGIQNRSEDFERNTPETARAAHLASDQWLQSLTTDDVQTLVNYSGKSNFAHGDNSKFDSIIKKAPPIEATKVYSGLSDYVAKDILAQLGKKQIRVDYPISTSLNAAQANGFMAPGDNTVALEIETNVGGSMLSVSHSPDEFEILLPSGVYEVLEIKTNIELLWEENGAGRTINKLVKLKRL